MHAFAIRCVASNTVDASIAPAATRVCSSCQCRTEAARRDRRRHVIPGPPSSSNRGQAISSSQPIPFRTSTPTSIATHGHILARRWRHRRPTKSILRAGRVGGGVSMKDQEKDPKEKDASAVTRRKFLTGIGAGAAGTIVAPAGALAQEGTLTQIENVTVTPTRTDRFTPHLQPAAVRRSERRRSAGAARVWRAGRAARCEGSARGRAGPVDHEPGAQSQQPRQPDVHGRHHVSRPVPRPRHDVRRDVEARRADARPSARPIRGHRRSISIRCTAADPTRSPQLYDPSDRIKFRVEHGGAFEDLPRSANDRAIIADPRNDENMMISGLQVAFLLFHNRVVDTIRAAGRNLAGSQPTRRTV